MPVTIAELKARYSKEWLISDAVGGGWYAVRRHGLSRDVVQRGLSNVYCGASLEELATHLASETQLETRLIRGCHHAETPFSCGGTAHT